ncbi:GMC oxidoreductase [Rhizobium sp. RU36D]|uniref:GMC oxidoreductase n=1 Tax=Rhizobium sp. RU36D TaxID=1907415 RepID=UPI0009D805D6|nr:GMC oxidoreductase [Rhizobium sp. RU36D]SMD20156.1 Choline dehydrogenase [Rhizobium sp. RU36D]
MIHNSIDGAPLGAFDACVVGSGPAGLVFSLEMAKRGKRVLLIESGGVKVNELQTSLSHAEIVDPDRHDDMRIAVSRRLGGTSNLWGGRCQPLDTIDFADRPWIGSQWPLELTELLPYYEAACHYLSAGKPVFHDETDTKPNSKFRIALERFSNKPKVQKAFWQELSASPLIDIRLNTTLTSVISRNHKVESIVVTSTDGLKTKIPVDRLVIACGGLESTRQLLIMQREQPDLFGGADGVLGKNYMGHIIGEVADIIFNDPREVSKFDFIVDRHGSYTRRRFVPADRLQRDLSLLNVSFWPVVPPIADPGHQNAALSAVCMALASPVIGKLFIAEAIRKRHIPRSIDWMGHLKNVLTGMPEAMRFVPWFVYNRYFTEMRLPGFFVRNTSGRYGLAYHCEQSPSLQSRVTLSEKTDRFGAPKLVIDIRFSDSDAEALLRAHAALGEWLSSQNFGRLEFRQPVAETVNSILLQASHGTHQIGTIRMGQNRANAIVDSNLEAFDCKNLYVVSSAVFPSSGQCNPTLTIAALAARLANTIGRP